jgi:N-acetylglucosaminyldiphosphoundecaprenol N-acetyl-beta-D-mannosaminyltransferase
VAKTRLQTVQVLGSKVDVLRRSDVLDCLRSWIHQRDGKCHRITVTGFHGLWEAYRDRELRQILNSADLWIADGIAPVLVARLKGVRRMPRIPGFELMDGFLQLANTEGYRSFFYGDTEETLAQLKTVLEHKYPGHCVCGTYSPPFRPLTPAEDEEVVRMINAAAPDVVWVGLGMPKQDRWIFEHKDKLNAPVAIGVGAAFRFHAGVVKRVPKVIGDLGLEWIWRFVMEPKKLWRRDLIAGPQFLFCVALELLGRKTYEPDTDRDLIGTP